MYPNRSRERASAKSRVPTKVCPQVVGTGEADKNYNRHRDRHSAVKDSIVRTPGKNNRSGRNAGCHDAVEFSTFTRSSREAGIRQRHTARKRSEIVCPG